MQKLRFYDLRNRKSFETDKYTKERIPSRGGTTIIAKTTAPSGVKATRIIGREK